MRVVTEPVDIRDRSKGYRVRAFEVIERGRVVMLEMSVSAECMDRYGGSGVFQDRVKAELRAQLKKGAVGL